MAGAPDRPECRGTMVRPWSARSSTRSGTNYGYDAQSGEYGNLMTKGIVPARLLPAATQKGYAATSTETKNALGG
jgi:hypothetical protein